MNNQERLKFYESKYIHELDARENIETRVRSPIPMLIIVAGLIGYLLKNTVLVKDFSYHYSLWLLLGVSGVSFVLSVYFFLRAIYGYYYLLLPTPERIEQYYQETLSKYQLVDPGKARKWASDAINEYLFDSYIRYASQNTKNNDTKSLNINRCLGALIISFLAVCFSYLPFYMQGF